METPEDLRERLEAAKKKLLEQGASSYLQAIVALNEFSREVQHRCADVLRMNLPALGDAIKIRMDESQISSILFPETISRDKWIAQHGASLGARINLKEHELAFAVEVCWWSENGDTSSIQASATIYVESKSKFQSAWPEFEKSQAQKYEEPYNYGIYFSEPILPNEMSTVQMKLATVTKKLVRAWDEAGGLKTFS